MGYLHAKCCNDALALVLVLHVPVSLAQLWDGFPCSFFFVPYCGAVEPENRVTRSYTNGVELPIRTELVCQLRMCAVLCACVCTTCVMSWVMHRLDAKGRKLYMPGLDDGTHGPIDGHPEDSSKLLPPGVHHFRSASSN